MTKLLGLTILALSLFYGLSYGSDNGLMYAQWGVAVAHPEASSDPSRVKNIEFGYQRSYSRFETRLGGGGWTDKSQYEGANNAVYIQYLLGLETRKRDGLYVAYFIGPAGISHTDSLLGSHLQISQQLHIGIRDSRRIGISAYVGHFSNAGLAQPNKGRNFAGVGVRF